MVQDPHWRKARLHLIATAFQQFAGISYQFGNPGLEYWHQPINNPRFADDIVLLAHSVEDLQTLVKNIHTVSKEVWFDNQQGETMQGPKWLPKKASLCPSTLMRKNWNKSRELHLSRGILLRKVNLHWWHQKKDWPSYGRNAENDYNSVVTRIHNRNQSRTVSGADSIYSYIYTALESRTLKKTGEHGILVFEMPCLRWTLGIRKTPIRETSSCYTSVVDTIKAKQLSHFGHTIRMLNYPYPKITLKEGSQARGPAVDHQSNGKTT